MRKFLKFIVTLALVASLIGVGFIFSQTLLTKNNMTIEIARKQIVDYCNFINDMETDFSFSTLPEEQDYNKVVATHSSETVMFVPYLVANALHGEIKENQYYNISGDDAGYLVSNMFNFYYNIDSNIITAYLQQGDYNYVLILDTLKDDNNLQTLKLYLFYTGSYNGNFYNTNYYNYIELKSDEEKIVKYTEYTLSANYDSSQPSDTLEDIAKESTYRNAEYYCCDLTTHKLYSKNVEFTQYLDIVKGVSAISFDTVLTNKTVTLQYDYEY